MFSIRECTFETNSSSCHCLVICNKSLMEKLKNHELIYTGHFTYGQGTDDLYENEINPHMTIDREHLIGILKSFQDMDLTGALSYVKSCQNWLKEHDWENTSLKELINNPHFCIADVLRYLGFEYHQASTLFGGNDSYSTSIISEDEFLDPKTNEPVKILLTEMEC